MIKCARNFPKTSIGPKSRTEPNSVHLQKWLTQAIREIAAVCHLQPTIGSIIMITGFIMRRAPTLTILMMGPKLMGSLGRKWPASLSVAKSVSRPSLGLHPLALSCFRHYRSQFCLDQHRIAKLQPQTSVRASIVGLQHSSLGLAK